MEKEKLQKLIDEGKTVRQISDVVNSSFTNVRYWLGKHGIKPNGKKKSAPTQFNHIVAQRKRRERKIYCVKKLGGECQSCGYKKNLSALVFHHLNESEKSFELNARNIIGTTIEVIDRELEKCQLLCQNCHMELHNPDWIF